MKKAQIIRFTLLLIVSAGFAAISSAAAPNADTNATEREAIAAVIEALIRPWCVQ